MDRRKFIKTIGVASAGVVLSPAIASAAKSEKPNIILMMADDFGYECLSVNGGEPYKTFGHVMKAADYKTCIVGKWQMGRDRKLTRWRLSGRGLNKMW
jgi:hypothetical protein